MDLKERRPKEGTRERNWHIGKLANDCRWDFTTQPVAAPTSVGAAELLKLGGSSG
jgi:hypothetical protein